MFRRKSVERQDPAGVVGWLHDEKKGVLPLANVTYNARRKVDIYLSSHLTARICG